MSRTQPSRNNRRSLPLLAVAAFSSMSLSCTAEPVSTQERTARNATALTNSEVVAPGNKENGYAAFVEATLPGGLATSCSGALVAPDAVLTAAHCLVCAESVRVRFIGAPGVWHAAVPGGIHVHPDAYAHAGLPDCTLTNLDAYRAELDTRTLWNSDLGLVKIDPVAIQDAAPKFLMLSPPRGFSPTQYFFGRDVMLLGRGDAEQPGTTVMRRGRTSIDFFGPQGDSHNAWMLYASIGVPPGVTESFSMHGDSGGPVVSAFQGADRIFAVISLTQIGSSLFAATFSTRNASFLRAHLYPGSDPILDEDLDGDQVADAFDNCPHDANRDQYDLDEDGWGDVCDNCAPYESPLPTAFAQLEKFLPLHPDVAARSYNPTQDNCNEDAEPSAIHGHLLP